MKYLETEHEKKSFVITVIIYTVILLLCFFLGMTYMDPPPENGIAINFGTTEFGQGDVQPMEDVRMAPQQAQSAAEATPQADEVATQDVDDAPVVNKEKPQKETPKENVTPKPQPKPTPNKTVADAVNSVLNGPKTEGKSDQSQGNYDLPGDAGDRDGNRNSNGNGNGEGDGLGGRKGAGQSITRRGKPLPVPADCKDLIGKYLIIVKVTVDRAGNVTKAYVDNKNSSINASECLKRSARDNAMRGRYEPGSIDELKGEIRYNYDIR